MINHHQTIIWEQIQQASNKQIQGKKHQQKHVEKTLKGGNPPASKWFLPCTFFHELMTFIHQLHCNPKNPDPSLE